MHWRGVGVTTSIVILISSFRLSWGRRCATGCHGTGTRRPGACGEILRQRFHAADSVYRADFAGILFVYGAYSASVCGASAVTLPPQKIIFSVLAGYFVCGNLYRTQYVHQFTGRPNIAMYSVLIGALLNIC